MPERRVEADEFEALAADILSANSSLRFRARGGSMRPFIQNNDIIEVEPVAAGRLKRGHIVLCRLENGRLVVHRIVRLGSAAVVVQGDARALQDGWVPFQRILGRATLLEHNGRRLRLDSSWLSIAGQIWAILAPVRRRLMKWFHIS